ncbi:MAG: hydrogenase accessory protein HypB [Bacteroidetes bacterium]|nr:MAG: hydrogenase accessory protein HypB [Bacteroidota bacterium]RLD92154.1 MAG: hydrogenase accessory protein HypB [Bacteroidota bacterium]
MCDTCGCGSGTNPVRISRPGEPEQHHDDEHHDDNNHPHSHGHHHDHDHSHDHDHTHEHDHSHDSSRQRLIRVEEDILGKNNLLASRNSGYFEAKRVVALNLMSSPGSGKTTLLEKSIVALEGKRPVAVIEGDQQTMNDAERIHQTGAPVVQVNTGNGCHLDADMIRQALDQLQLQENSLLFIENVGNLVCPSLFELGEKNRIVIISVTEGEDKPLKYPTMFEHAHTCIINKIDLLPYVDFDTELVKKHILSVNPHLHIMELSAKTGEGMEQWITWLLDQKP